MRSLREAYRYGRAGVWHDRSEAGSSTGERRSKTMTEPAGKVTCRKRARACQFVNRDISLETCPQHLLGTELLPRLETFLWTARELGRTAMLLQSVGAEHHRDMV